MCPQATQADPLGPLANFIKELQDLSYMPVSGLDISALVSELPVPRVCDVEVMLVDDALEVCLFIFKYCVLHHC